jgi:hypothetical protein
MSRENDPPHAPVRLDLTHLPNDPSPEFLRELLRGNVTFVGEAKRVTAPPNMGSYLSWRELFGQPVTPEVFAQAFQVCSWKAVVQRAALLGAVLANRAGDQSPLDRVVREPLRRHRQGVNPVWAQIAEYVGDNPKRPLAHEQVVYLLVGMAILYGSEEGPDPSPEHVALMLLWGNDYLSNWSEADARDISQEETLAAEFVHVGRFNTYPDPLRDLVRVSAIYSRQPPQGPLSEKAEWSRVQANAFGSDFQDFFSVFLLPLLFETQRWGTESNGQWIAPVIEPARWYANTKVSEPVGKEFIAARTTTRQEARAEIGARMLNGVPHAPTVFIRKPFLQLDADRVIAVTPWVVREQLKGGAYTAFSRVVNAAHDKEVWPSAFGHLFELYCRAVAQMAATSASFKGRLILSAAPGSPDEIEDVVLVEPAGCLLGSVKSRLVKEDVARQARSRTALLDWYDSFLFAQPKGRYQAGALRLLDRTITEIRAGKIGAIEATTTIAPVLITFDDMADNPMLSIWIAKRCRQEGLFQQANVVSPALAPVDEFEVLMTLAAAGDSVIALLDAFARNRASHSNLNNFLHAARGGERSRLPALEEEFERLAERAKRSLFKSTKPM